MPDLTAVKNAPARSGSSCPPGRSGTPGPGSRCSPSPGCPAPRRRRSTTRRRCTGSPGWRRASRCTSRGTRWTTTPALAAYAAEQRRRDRHRQRQRVPGRRLQARQRVPTRTRGCAARPLDHLLECVDIMDATGSRDLKLWFADGTNYPGQDDITARQDRLAEALARSTSGSAAQPADDAGVQAVRAVVLHHRRARTGAPRCCTAWRSGRRPRCAWTPGTTRRARTSSSSWPLLLRAGRLGGVRLQLPVLRRRRPDGRRGRPVPAVPHPARGGPRRTRCDPAAGIAFMLDQCHNIEPKIPAQIRSVMNVQEATAKALLVDTGGAGRRPAGRRRARRQRAC